MFLEMEVLSSWAAMASRVSCISPNIWAVSMPCSSKTTTTPKSFNSRVVSMSSSVLRANWETDFTRMRVIFPARQSWSIRLNSSRFSRLVPVMPSSA